VHLKNLGVNVLGLADEPYQNLRPELRSALTEYYQVTNMHDYDQLLRATGLLIHHHGKIDRLDSLNEYWLETEANLRTDFNIVGIKNDEIVRIKRKSAMKEAFISAGIEVARGKLVNTLSEARKLVVSVGLPVVAKPDIGVGQLRHIKFIP
jgi:biotin carboxylase